MDAMGKFQIYLGKRTALRIIGEGDFFLPTMLHLTTKYIKLNKKNNKHTNKKNRTQYNREKSKQKKRKNTFASLFRCPYFAKSEVVFRIFPWSKFDQILGDSIVVQSELQLKRDQQERKVLL